MNRVIETFVLAYLLLTRLVSDVIRNTEIFIVVTKLLDLVNVVRSHSEMQVQDFLVLTPNYQRLHFLDVSIGVLGSDLDNRAS